jgi:hypothetical protein
MEKFFSRMLGAKKETFYLQVTIVSLDIPVKEATERVQVYWKRGIKREVTKGEYVLSPSNSMIEINETFKKMSIFYKDEKKSKKVEGDGGVY